MNQPDRQLLRGLLPARGLHSRAREAQRIESTHGQEKEGGASGSFPLPMDTFQGRIYCLPAKLSDESRAGSEREISSPRDFRHLEEGTLHRGDIRLVGDTGRLVGDTGRLVGDTGRLVAGTGRLVAGTEAAARTLDRSELLQAACCSSAAASLAGACCSSLRLRRGFVLRLALKVAKPCWLVPAAKDC